MVGRSARASDQGWYGAVERNDEKRKYQKPICLVFFLYNGLKCWFLIMGSFLNTTFLRRLQLRHRLVIGRVDDVDGHFWSAFGTDENMVSVTAPSPGDWWCGHGGKLLLGMPVCSKGKLRNKTLTTSLSTHSTRQSNWYSSYSRGGQ